MVTIPDSTEYFVGLRSWTTRGWTLTSPSVQTHDWPQSDPMDARCDYQRAPNDLPSACPCAYCRGHRTSPPDENCRCGLYGTYLLRRIVRAWYPTSVVGLVKGWGKVIPGQDGFRAQFARPLGFIALSAVSRYSEDELRRLARSYNVPVLQQPPHHLAWSSALTRNDWRENFLAHLRENIRATGEIDEDKLARFYEHERNSRWHEVWTSNRPA